MDSRGAGEVSRRLALVGVVLWGAGGACFLAGWRTGADLALGLALVLFAAAITPLPRLPRSLRPLRSPRRRPANGEEGMGC